MPKLPAKPRPRDTFAGISTSSCVHTYSNLSGTFLIQLCYNSFEATSFFFAPEFHRHGNFCNWKAVIVHFIVAVIVI